MAAPISKHLTTSQFRIAQMVADFGRQGKPTFVSDLAVALRLAGTSSLVGTIEKMAHRGFLEIRGGGTQGRYRLVELTAKARRALGIGGLRVLATIPDGRLPEVVAQAEEFIELDKLLPIRDGDFLLRVKGDSMIGEGILDGDLALVRPHVEIPSQSIAAVRFDDELQATLRRVFYEGEQVRLKASNPAFKDILVLTENVHFCGLFKGVVRNV